MGEEKVTRGRKSTATIVETKNETEIEKQLKEEKEKNSQMEQMLKQLQDQMIFMQNQLSAQSQGNSQVVIKQNDDLTRTVKVISTLPNRYDLPTQNNGVGGKVYTFRKFGDTQNIRFTDMIDILAKFTNQFEKGYAVLTSKKDYEDLGIGYIWDSVPTFENLEKIIQLENDESVDIILSMDKDMQDKIAHTIAINISQGKSYDYNRIKDLENEGFEINEIVEMLNAEKNK